jgi:hypothetical protein
MLSHLESKKVKDDLELEWLLCLASTLESSQRIQPTEAGVAPRHTGLPRSENQKSIESLLKKAFNLSRKDL